jgi:hypothetical protein
MTEREPSDALDRELLHFFYRDASGRLRRVPVPTGMRRRAPETPFQPAARGRWKSDIGAAWRAESPSELKSRLEILLLPPGAGNSRLVSEQAGRPGVIGTEDRES